MLPSSLFIQRQGMRNLFFVCSQWWTEWEVRTEIKGGMGLLLSWTQKLLPGETHREYSIVILESPFRCCCCESSNSINNFGQRLSFPAFHSYHVVPKELMHQNLETFIKTPWNHRSMGKDYFKFHPWSVSTDC